MVIVFDLDDTLYLERYYVLSGFRAVADFLGETVGGEPVLIFEDLCAIEAAHGRGSVFDKWLTDHDCYTTLLLKKCIAVYRLHAPKIRLNEDAERILTRFSDLSLYIVTDGNKIVQSKKIDALNLKNKVKRVFITHQYGLQYSKPSPYCFQRILEIEKVVPNQVVYIGDNPQKDFVGIKPMGFRTIRILQGMHKSLKLSELQEAHINVQSLNEIDFDLLKNI